jgi:hypothetical protein
MCGLRWNRRGRIECLGTQSWAELGKGIPAGASYRLGRQPASPAIAIPLRLPVAVWVPGSGGESHNRPARDSCMEEWQFDMVGEMEGFR